jgi:hypothetical protein
MVMERLTVPAQTPATVQERSRQIGLRARLAQSGTAFVAARAVAAIWDKNTNHFVSGGQIVYALAGPDYLTGGLMSQNHGHDARTAAVQHAQIGVAQAGRANAHQNLARTGAVQLAFFDAQGLPDLVQDRGVDTSHSANRHAQ